MCGYGIWRSIISVGIGASLAFLFGWILQKRLLKIANREKSIDFLIENINIFRQECDKYWSSHPADVKHVATAIKIKQTQLSKFLKATHEKYKFKHLGKCDLVALCTEASGDDFETANRSINPGKVVKINKLADALIITLLKNKI